MTHNAEQRGAAARRPGRRGGGKPGGRREPLSRAAQLPGGRTPPLVAERPPAPRVPGPAASCGYRVAGGVAPCAQVKCKGRRRPRPRAALPEAAEGGQLRACRLQALTPHGTS